MSVYGQGLDVTIVAGSDISPEAVAESARTLRALAVAPDVKEGCMTRIDQPDETFSLVIAFRVIHHAVRADIAKAITEVHRILVPGGYFFVTFKVDTEARPPGATIIDAQTAIWQEEPEKGIPHFYSRRGDLDVFLSAFTMVSLKYCESYEPPGFEVGRRNACSRGSTKNHACNYKYPAVEIPEYNDSWAHDGGDLKWRRRSITGSR